MNGKQKDFQVLKLVRHTILYYQVPLIWWCIIKNIMNLAEFALFSLRRALFDFLIRFNYSYMFEKNKLLGAGVPIII